MLSMLCVLFYQTIVFANIVFANDEHDLENNANVLDATTNNAKDTSIPKYNFITIDIIPIQYIHNDGIDRQSTVGFTYFRKHHLANIISLYYGATFSYTYLEDDNSETKTRTINNGFSFVPKVAVGIALFKEYISLITGFGLGFEHQRITKNGKLLQNFYLDGQIFSGLLFNYSYFAFSVIYKYSTIASARGAVFSIGVNF